MGIGHDDLVVALSCNLEHGIAQIGISIREDRRG
jgi:hypothetical protein